jgi:hypothetical protein
MAGLYLPAPQAGCDEAARRRLRACLQYQVLLPRNPGIATQEIPKTI